MSGRSASFVDRYMGVRREGTDPLGIGEENIRINTLHGILNSAALNMVGPFTAIFAMRIGATQLHVALLTSAPAIVSLLAMIPGARFIDRTERKKRVTLVFMAANRVGYLFLACVPFFAHGVQASIFVLLLALMNLPGAVSNIAWQAFISRIVPPEKRSRAFAARNRLMNLFGTTITVCTGLFLDHSVFPIGYQLAFVGAFVVAVAELLVFRKINDTGTGDGVIGGRSEPITDDSATAPAQPPQATSERRSALAVRFNLRIGALMRSQLTEILSEKRFVRYMLVSVYFYLAWQTPWPLFSWYQVRILHANNLWVSILALLNTGGALAGYGYWQRMLDKRGNLRTLLISSLPIFIVPLVYAFSGSLLIIGLSNLVIGAIFSGVNLALFNTLLEMTPETKKATYLAYYTTAVTVASVLAPLLGVAFLQVMSFRYSFIACAAFRLSGSLAFLFMERLERRKEAEPLPAT
ncbi:MAG TPA: MFS transporter [Spirochaetia bacterium]|nr:MFS transporter [Spirochaetia bacterium]